MCDDFKYTAKIIFELPLEVLSLTFSLMEPKHLMNLFQLDQLKEEPIIPDPYLLVRHLALFHYYSNGKVIVSNSRFTKSDHIRISCSELRYLFDNNITIKPKEITFILDNEPCPHELFNYVSIFNDAHFFQKLKSFTHQLNMELILNTNFDTQNNLLVARIFNCLNGSGFDKTFELKVHNRQFSSPGHTHEQFPNRNNITYRNRISELQMTDVEGHFNNDSNFNYNFTNIQVNKLTLQNFKPERLVNYFTNNTMSLKNLKKLNLSFNSLSDLSRLEFPDSLTHLDLSNNCLVSLDSSNFNWKNLVNLQELNLANNNLLSVELKDNSMSEKSYSLHTIYLCCNNLTDVRFLTTSKFFSNLRRLDLSRNLISNLDKFPVKLIHLNLTGNYLSNIFHQLNGNIFPKGLMDLNLSWCKIDMTSHAHSDSEDASLLLVSKIINLEELFDLRVLRFDGNNLECDSCFFELDSRIQEVQVS